MVATDSAMAVVTVFEVWRLMPLIVGAVAARNSLSVVGELATCHRRPRRRCALFSSRLADDSSCIQMTCHPGLRTVFDPRAIFCPDRLMCSGEFCRLWVDRALSPHSATSPLVIRRAPHASRHSRLVVESERARVLTVAPPILSRAYQDALGPRRALALAWLRLWFE